MTTQDEYFLREAIALAKRGMEANEGGPFGALVVRDGQIIGRGNNRETSTNDPTAPAEVVAIRAACAALNSIQLTAAIDFDDDFIYREIPLPAEERSIPTEQALREEGRVVFRAWRDKTDRQDY